MAGQPLVHSSVGRDTLMLAVRWAGRTPVWAGYTVIWGFSFAPVFGAGFRPHLWSGQKTQRSWDDVD